MKPTNEQLLEAFRAADLAFMVADFAKNSGGNSLNTWRDGHLSRFNAYAATLPDELETESLQLDDHIVDTNKKVGYCETLRQIADVIEIDHAADAEISRVMAEREPEPRKLSETGLFRDSRTQFEVGGTCDYDQRGIKNAEIVAIRGHEALLVYIDESLDPTWRSSWVPFELPGITNYKPPAQTAGRPIYLPVHFETGKVDYLYVEYDYTSYPMSEASQVVDGWVWMEFKIVPARTPEVSK